MPRGPECLFNPKRRINTDKWLFLSFQGWPILLHFSSVHTRGSQGQMLGLNSYTTSFKAEVFRDGV